MAVIYDKVLVYAEGKLLAEEAQVTFSRQANAVNMYTVGVGFAGQSAGPGMCNISITNMVPAKYDNGISASSLFSQITGSATADTANGLELDVSQYLTQRKTLQLVIFSGGKSVTIDAYITDDTLSHAINSNASQAINGVARLPSFN